MPLKVTDPSGEDWVVRRRWMPRTPRWRRLVKRRAGHGSKGKARSRLDVADLPIDFEPFLTIAAVIGAIALMIWFGIPLLLFVLETLWLLVILIVGIAAKVLLRRPWTIEAAKRGSAVHSWQIVGWRASSASIERLAEEIRTSGWPVRPPDARS